MASSSTVVAKKWRSPYVCIQLVAVIYGSALRHVCGKVDVSLFKLEI